MTSSVRLVTANGGYVTDLQIDGYVPPNFVVWGTRLYVRRDDGDYQEVLSAAEQAVAVPVNLITERANQDGF